MTRYDDPDLRTQNLDDTRHLLPDVSVLSGVGPEAPKTVNEKGGRQSLKKWRFDLVHAGAFFVLGRILDRGSKEYGDWNWLKIDVEDHLNSAIMHIYAYLNGDRSDDHLGHAFCRCMFALGVALRDGYDARQADEKQAA